MTSHIDCTGVILAGGMNMRFGGRNKALVEIGGKTILDRTLSVFGDLFPETMVVTNTPLSYLSCNSLIVTDIFTLRTPLAGIHAALSYAKTQYIFVVACDTPFLATPMIEAILEKVDTKSDVVVPDTVNGFQPLCAVYSKACLPPIEKQLREASAAAPETGGPAKRVLNQGLKILNFYERVRVKKIPEASLRQVDPDLLSFFNVNTPEDFARAEQILSENQNL
jgi:molybdopterin-guanine dinucleotide biosynthesis protein A